MPGTFDYKTQAIQALAPAKVRWRKPFTAQERGRRALRLGQKSLTAAGGGLTASNLLSAQAIASNGSIAVAVGVTYSSGTSGTVAASTADGITWTSRAVPLDTYSSVVWTGSIFVASNATVGKIKSSDGVTWTSGTATGGGAPIMFAFNGKAYAFLGSSATYYDSSDAVTWNTRTLPQNFGASASRLSANSSFMYFSAAPASGAGNMAVYRTSDGINWSQSNAFSMNVLPCLAASNGTVIGLSASNGGLAYTISTDNGATFSNAIAIKPTVLYSLSSQTPALLGSLGGFTGVPAFASVGTGKYYEDIGRFVFFVQLQITYTTGASVINSYSTSIIHTTDGTDWVLEDLITGGSGSGTPLNPGDPLIKLGTDLYVPNSITSGTFWLNKINKDFEELVCDY